MPFPFVRTAAAIVAAALMPAVAAAQAAAQAAAPAAAGQCDIDDSKPKQLGMATFTLQRVAGAKSAADRPKGVREMTKALGEMKTAENPAGQAFLYGQAAMMWMQDPEAPDVVTRGDFGLPGEKGASLDLVVFADSVFDQVEAQKPNCKTLVTQWRGQQGWFRNIQTAFTAIGQQEYAKAEAAARRSLILNTRSAYAPYVIGAVSQQRMNESQGAEKAALADSAVKYLGLAVGEAGNDTSFADIRRRSLLDIGRIRIDQFETGAVTDFKGACGTIAPRVAQAFEAYLAENATQPDALAARNNLASLHLQCGDTAKAEAVYDPVVKNPTAYGDIEATQGGVTMTRINRNAKAAALFEAALQVNPFQRDALNNLAATYYNTQRFAEMMPIVGRLVAVDPNNPDNWLWYAYAYQGLSKPLKNADPKKKAYSDSLVYFNNMSETMAVRVSFTNFTRGAEETRLAGTVEYRAPQSAAPARPAPRGKAGAKAAAPAAPAAPPKDVTIALEWLDKSGTVLETTPVAVGAVKPGETKEFTTSVKKTGVTAYRYAKIN
ncbi:MAG: hypothetical protein ACK6AH_10425 [Gemmatimonadota bacterium]